MESVYLGVDLGGTNILAAVVAADGTVLGRAKNDVTLDKGMEAVARQMWDLSDLALTRTEYDWESVAAIGIAVPSAVDPQTGNVLCAPNLGWKDELARPVISEVFDRPVVLENDVNCGVWGEVKCGAAKGYDNVAGYFIGTGIGGGLVLNGQLHLGVRGMAAELGHEIVRANGRKCGCGRRGCLEAYCSKTAFCRQFKKQINGKGKKSVLSKEMKSFERVKSSVLAKAYRGGDTVTRKTLHQGVKMLGVASANVAAMFGPQCIVYGGGVMEALGEELMPKIVTHTNRNLFGLKAGDVELCLSSLLDDAVPVGAALLGKDRMPEAVKERE